MESDCVGLKRQLRLHMTGRPGHEQSADSPSATSTRSDNDSSKSSELPLSPETSEHSSQREPLGVVGIGASAGGLAALKALFADTPGYTGMAFVVVVHLSPEHPSQLAELLQPHTKMPVRQVTETTRIDPNEVYLIPPNANLEAVDTHLRLTPLESARSQRAPIDHFFETMARTHDGNSAAVILTGTGSDGSLGLQCVKEAGGFTIVQDPVEAEFDGMPQSAISTGWVDLIAPLRTISDSLVAFSSAKPALKIPAPREEIEDETREVLQQALRAVHTATGRDFTQYRTSTILRRIMRRMQFHRLEDPALYLEMLNSQPEEARALAEDLLITVSSFFRDPTVFRALEEKVLPEIFEHKEEGDEIRVWSAGCATGEEAYSLAILLLEEADRRELTVPIQIFGSDLHPRALQKAREGYYSGELESAVGSERLRRYFKQEAGGYRIRPELRERVVFSAHNLLGDPPFSQIDLISCRNVLIYLERHLQERVIELFHYALKPEGFLMLGLSEAVEATELFRSIDGPSRIFRKRNVPGPEPRLPVFPLTPRHFHGRTRPGTQNDVVPYSRIYDRSMEDYAPASVLVSPDDNVVHFSNKKSSCLVQPRGAPTTSLFKLARSDLWGDLHTTVATARQTNRACRSNPAHLRVGEKDIEVTLDVRPAPLPEHEGFLLVVFEEKVLTVEPVPASGSADEARPDDSVAAESDARQLQGLRAEQVRSRARLRTALDEYETSREELRASNEELQSTNEELRSTLEELETSREELQSMNEELQTVNQENRHKVEELAQLSGDLQNLLTSTDIATLFIDRDFHILRFTPQVAELFNVRLIDRGRPLSHITHRLGYDELLCDAARVLDRLVPVEREILDQRGQTYLTRVLPYRGTDDRIEGVVITFVDITRRSRAEEALRENEVRLAAELESMQQLHALVGRLLLTTHLSEALNEVLKGTMEITSAEMGDVQIIDPRNGETQIAAHAGFGDEATHLLETDDSPARSRAMASGTRVVVSDVREDPSFRSLIPVAEVAGYTGLQCTPLISRSGEVLGTLSTHYSEPYHPSPGDLRRLDLYTRLAVDYIERARAEEQLRQSEAKFRATFEISHASAIRGNTATGEILEVNGTFTAMLGYSRDELLGKSILDITHPLDRERAENTIRSLASGRISSSQREKRLVRKDGSTLWGFVALNIVPGEQRSFFMAMILDVTRRHEVESSLEEQAKRKDEYIAMLGHELRNPLAAIQNATDLMGISMDGEPRLVRAHGVLQRQTTHMTRLVDGLLEIARIERGKVDLQRSTLDLTDVVRAVVQDHEPQITKLGLQLHCELPNETLWVRGDRTRVEQIIANILTNAVKFTDSPGEIAVLLRIETAGELNSSALISVRDTGIGIPTERLGRIFEAFHQEEQSLSRSAGGLGLGLALAKELVQLHDGDIRALSAGEGCGTEIQIRFPLELAPEAEERAERISDVPSLRVLVVEDNPDTGETLRELLLGRGHLVRLVHSGINALEALRTEGANVVLCDIGLPGMTGYELARVIRADSDLSGVVLIACTGYGQQDARTQALEAGFDSHLTKPIRLADLEEALEGVFVRPMQEHTP